ncbi:hypothetical protein B5807_08566 [Epicoccum nigrum]|uniref:Uncharacterized protein n=1 Tax=Epicoccum nigrum TaxID=105696 RepID=A0A1Y2LTF9_EPING|nr:hypothetical protein B5807_08566 [Epicoccum nigrum]
MLDMIAEQGPDHVRDANGSRPRARIHCCVPDERSSKRTPGLGKERFRGGRKHFQHINNALSGNCFSGSSSLIWPEERWNIMRAVLKQRAKAPHPGHAGRT